MIRRPLSTQLTSAFRRDIKVSTIREKAWPVGVPIMIYNWSGVAYRSKQIEVGPVMVTETTPISITRPVRGDLWYSLEGDILQGKPLWRCEGFASQDEMDDWFSAKIKPGRCVEMHLMRFHRLPVIKT
jgi:hypothetical protein